MIPVKHIDPEDLPLYAMQLLSPEETAEITLHLQHSAEARRVLAEIQGDLAALAHTAEMHSPPALARQRLMKHVAREKKPVPIDRFQNAGMYAPRESTLLLEEEAPKKSFAGRVLPWVGWAIAAGMTVEAGNLYQQKMGVTKSLIAEQSQVAKLSTDVEIAKTVSAALQDPGAMHITLTSGDAKPVPTGRATYLQDKGQLIFLASNLDPLQTYKTYELWLIPSDGHDPIPAGTFKPDRRGNAVVILPQLPKGIGAKAFGVTIEDDGGATTPTMPIILAGKPV